MGYKVQDTMKRIHSDNNELNSKKGERE